MNNQHQIKGTTTHSHYDLTPTIYFISQSTNRSLFVLSLLFLHISGPFLFHANAFDLEGISAVGMTAMSALKKKTNYHIKNLFHGKDLADNGNWLKSFTSTHHELEDSFYQLYKFKADKDGNCDEIEFTETSTGPSLVKMTEDLYSQLIGNITNNNVLNKLNLNEAEGVALFSYFMYLIHKPFHFSTISQNFGLDLHVEYTIKRGARKVNTSLHNLYEEELVNLNVNNFPESWNQGWTHISQIQGRFKIGERDFGKDGPSIFYNWALEKASEECKIMQSLEPRFKDNLFNVDMSIPLKTQEIKQYILEAGARVAIVLNSIYNERPITSLRSRVTLRPFEEQNVEKLSLPEWGRNFIINASICCVILVILFYIMSFYSDTNNYIPISSDDAKQEKELQEKMS